MHWFNKQVCLKHTKKQQNCKHTDPHAWLKTCVAFAPNSAQINCDSHTVGKVINNLPVDLRYAGERFTQPTLLTYTYTPCMTHNKYGYNTTFPVNV